MQPPPSKKHKKGAATTDPSSPDNIRHKRLGVLVFTFLINAFFHLWRRAWPIVKATLVNDWEDSPYVGSKRYIWLGVTDAAFLGMYAIGLTAFGRLVSDGNAKAFLTIGLMLCGACGFLISGDYVFHINHNAVAYFVSVLVAAGLFQASGWPVLLRIVGRWTETINPLRRARILSTWASSSSLGNIFGSIACTALLQNLIWPYVFVVPSAVLILTAVFVLAILWPSPSSCGFSRHDMIRCDNHGATHQLTDDDDDEDDGDDEREDDDVALAKNYHTLVDMAASNNGTLIGTERPPLTCCEAMSIPVMIPYGLSMFFAQFVTYTFLYWMPFYLVTPLPKRPEGGYYPYSPIEAGYLSLCYDAGAVVGGWLLGLIAKRFQMRALISCVVYLLAIPVFAIPTYGLSEGLAWWKVIGLMLLFGFLTQGPEAIVTAAIATDLTRHPLVRNNPDALATATAIVHGIGALGATCGPLVAGLVAQYTRNWTNECFVLMGAMFLAAMLLAKPAYHDFFATCIHPPRSTTIHCKPPKVDYEKIYGRIAAQGPMSPVLSPRAGPFGEGLSSPSRSRTCSCLAPAPKA